MLCNSRFPAWCGTALAFGVTIAIASTATAQQTLPSGRAVVDRYIEAIGGRDAILAQTGRHAWGRIEIPAQGMTGDLELYAQPPNKLRVNLTLTGIGEILTGYDGATGWGVNPMTGPTVPDSLELVQLKQQANFYSDLYGPEFIASLETVSRERFAEADSADCYKVKITATWGETYYEFFDVGSGLRLGSQRSQASPMGTIEIVSVARDWRVIDGLKVPFKNIQRTMGIQNIATIDSLHVMAVPDSVFALPAEIRALIKK